MHIQVLQPAFNEDVKNGLKSVIRIIGKWNRAQKRRKIAELDEK